MTQPTSKPRTLQPVLVDTPQALSAMAAHLSIQSAFALDTESNSFYVYYPKVCLIQITTFADAQNPATDNVIDYLVDPLALSNLDELGALTARGDIQVIMHAAENDILQLRRDFGFTFPNVFDTQLAARILGWERVGLGAMLEERFGVVSDKRMQRTDWAVRPLTEEQVVYAQMDTHYLLALRDQMLEALADAGRLEEYEDALTQLEQFDGAERSPIERTFWQMKLTRSLDLEHTGVLETLWNWREREAQRTNRPPFKIMGDESLIDLAVTRPTTAEQLKDVARLSRQQANRYGSTILKLVEEGAQRPLPPLPRPAVRPELLLSQEDQERFEKLRRWRTETARKRGVAPEIVFNNDTLLGIVQRHPTNGNELLAVPGVGPWKVNAYGEAVFALLNGNNEK
jgi:ribonuclease D